MAYREDPGATLPSMRHQWSIFSKEYDTHTTDLQMTLAAASLNSQCDTSTDRERMFNITMCCREEDKKRSIMGRPLYLVVALDTHCGHHIGASVQFCADALAAALAIVAMFPLCAMT